MTTYLKIDNIEKIEKKCFNQNTTEYDLTMSEALRRFMSVFNRYPKLAFRLITTPEQFIRKKTKRLTQTTVEELKQAV